MDSAARRCGEVVACYKLVILRPPARQAGAQHGRLMLLYLTVCNTEEEEDEEEEGDEGGDDSDRPLNAVKTL